MKSKTLIIIAFAVCALILPLFIAPIPLSGTKGVHIVSSVQTSQGQFENDTEMELVRVNGTLVNDGDITAENFKLSVVFIDEAHDKVVIRTIYENVDLPPNSEHVMGFESQYLREKTIPKTLVNATVQLEWMEDGVLKQG
ncbi:MAG: hypothetical protein E4G94_09510 [ANME-2 cluster archaeon]|nr:MAG: hypothetical protein E4G94_09510 [ANME-2 cluster archaeon]